MSAMGDDESEVHVVLRRPQQDPEPTEARQLVDEPPVGLVEPVEPVAGKGQAGLHQRILQGGQDLAPAHLLARCCQDLDDQPAAGRMHRLAPRPDTPFQKC